MEPFIYTLPTRIVFGPGTLDQLTEECAARFRRPAVISGRAHFADSGLKARVDSLLAAAGVTPVHLTGIGAVSSSVGCLAGSCGAPGMRPPQEPTCGDCERLAAEARAAGCDGVIGIGGGSAMDTAKAVALLLAAPPASRLVDFIAEWTGETRAVPGRAPLLLVPTTVGTGSEANSGLVISDESRGHKLTFFHPALYADVALVDPDLTATLPLRQLRLGLFDAFCHIAETYLTAHGAFRVTEALVETLLARLVRLSADPAADAARAELAHISLLGLSGLCDAGLSGVYPLHDLAAPLTARLKVPHAAALALLFVPLAAFSESDPVVRERFARLHAAIDPDRSSPTFLAFMRDWILWLDLRPPVPRGSAGDDDLHQAMAFDCVTLFGGGGMTVENSVPLHIHEMAAIYREALAGAA